MRTWWTVEFDGDTYELRSNAIGKEELRRNGIVIGRKFNLGTKGNYSIQSSKHGTCVLDFRTHSSDEGTSEEISITCEGTVLATYTVSVEHLLPSWLQTASTKADENKTETRQPAWRKPLSIVGWLVVAFVVWGLIFSWETAPVLMVALLFHEAGHYVVMRIAGYRNRRLVILPPFGAAVYGEKAESSDWERFCMYMAGPLPGILLAGGLVLLFGTPEQGSLYDNIFVMLIALNYFNLLPVVPLDGGRIVETMFLRDHPVVQAILTGIGVVALGVLSIVWQDVLLGTVVLIVAVLLVSRVRELRRGGEDETCGSGEYARWYQRLIAAVLYFGLWVFAIVRIV